MMGMHENYISRRDVLVRDPRALPIGKTMMMRKLEELLKT